MEISQEIIEIVFDLIIKAFDSVRELINQDIYIPGVSEFLDYIGVGRFSLLDVMCYAASFLANFTYKIIRQEPLMDEKTYQAVMAITTLSDLGRLGVKGPAVLAGNDQSTLVGTTITEPSRTIYILCKVLSGVCAGLETAISALFKAVPATQDNPLILVFTAGDGLCYVAASFALAPLKDRVPLQKYSLIFSIIKYAPYGIVGFAEFYRWRKPAEGARADTIKLVGRGCYAVTSFLTIIVDVVYIVQGVMVNTGDIADPREKQQVEKEKELFLMDVSSLIFDNVRNVLDFVLYLPVAKPPQVRIPVLVVRSLLAAGYSVLQVAEGIDASSSLDVT